MLPRWLVVATLALFVGHYAMVGISLFSKQFIGERYYYLTYHYLSPWFYQNITAFAPEPPLDQKWFIYRLKTEQGWSNWKYPAYKYLQGQWANRFSTDAKVHDQMEVVADYVFKTFTTSPADSLILTDRAPDLPVMDAAQRLIIWENPGALSIDSFQAGVFVRHHEVISRELIKTDTAMLFPIVSWKNKQP